ncbi:uncharacterized protein [Elaeis guineensis]|nr:uncharacterized protein LOC105049254 isoform X2 [Elaeis guineensis]XP_010927149.1 uncharacterized protein LOC105049254 isoform X2 [Elaeis guineensis]XP_029121637.1 uncharacterized protein LOC105049254 isoform X2 [Elaeis guineensis]
MAEEGDDISALLSEPSGSDEVIELSDAISTMLSLSTKSDDKAEELSPEEAAWVDSCLVSNPELSDDKWSELRDALLDTLSAYPTSYETPSAANVDGTPDELKESKDECAYTGEEAEPTLIHVKGHHLAGDIQRDGAADVEASVDFQENIESRENIFKVWDLKTQSPDEEDDDELIKQLKKLLTGGSLQDLSQPLDDPSTALSQEKVDELVASMDDLSLETCNESKV